MKLALVLITILFPVAFASAQQSRVLLDNEWVKVSHVNKRSENESLVHSHKDTIVIALADHGKTGEADIRADEAKWFGNVTHLKENVGKKSGELLIVELKRSAGSWRPASTEDDPTKWPDQLEAVRAAPGNHKVVFENDRVRVLDVTVAPGENERIHMHRMPSVLYVIAEDDIQDFDATGKLLYDSRTQKQLPQTPYTEWMPPQAAHRVVNRSKRELRLIRIEVK